MKFPTPSRRPDRCASVRAARSGAGTLALLALALAALASDASRAAARPVAGGPFRHGADPGDGLGAAVATGDLNGDGRDDLVLGAPGGDGRDDAREDAGEVYVVYGGAAARPGGDLSSLLAAATRIDGADAGDRAGSALACGDLDGDGYDDLVVGSPGADGPDDGVAGAGEVAVIYGGPALLPDIDLSASPAVPRIAGDGRGDRLGSGLAAGDLNGDGLEEMILLASGSPHGEVGEIGIVYGDPDPIASGFSVAAASVARIDPPASSMDAVAAGDLNGDGYDDLLARYAASRVAIVYGGPAPLPDIGLDPPPAWISVVSGLLARTSPDFAGPSVAAGDLDGDGYDDAILGADGLDVPSRTGRGAGGVAIVYGGPEALPDFDLALPPGNVRLLRGADRGGLSGDTLGGCVATGDLDGDGFDDAVLGAAPEGGTGDAGAGAGGVVVLYGRPDRPDATDLATRSPDVAFFLGVDPGDGGDGDGGVLATGDLDGDGFDEMILGAPSAGGSDAGPPGAGEVAVVPGAPRERYRHDPAAFAFIDATAGDDVGLACDDCSATIPIGFTFEFFGRPHDSVVVSSNGYLTFGGTGDSPFGFCSPTSSAPNDVIAVFWDDLNPSAGGRVHYLLEGAAPSRRLTVEWEDVPAFPAVGAATFEVTLFEGSNQILFQYRDVLFGGLADAGATAAAGVENVTGYNGTPYSCFQPSLSAGTAARFRPVAIRPGPGPMKLRSAPAAGLRREPGR